MPRAPARVGPSGTNHGEGSGDSPDVQLTVQGHTGAVKGQLQPPAGEAADQAAPAAWTQRLGPGDALELQLDGSVAKLLVGTGAAPVQIEIAAAGYVADEFFVATFVGARIGALVRLGEDYDHVRPIDLKLMVGAERDVTGFPTIALVGEPGGRRVRIEARGRATRVELAPLRED